MWFTFYSLVNHYAIATLLLLLYKHVASYDENYAVAIQLYWAVA